MNYEITIRDIIAKSITTTESIDLYDMDADLQNIGMNSLTFINIIVEIENQFDIEIPEDNLIADEIGTIKKLCTIVENIKKESA